LTEHTVTTEDLKNKYQNLLSIDNKRRKARNVGSVLVTGGIFVPLLIIYFIENIGDIGSWAAIAAMFTAMIMGSYIEGKNKKEIFSPQQKAFYEFYSTYAGMRRYCDIPNDEKTRKNTLSRLNRLAQYIHSWTGKNAPQEISELPKSIYKNIRERIIPLIQENKVKEIQSLMKEISEFLMFLYDNEPTITKLKSFNNFIESSFPVVVKIKEMTHGEAILAKYPMLKYVWISPVAGAIFGSVLYQIDPAKIFEAIAYSVTTAVGILVAIITISRRKQ
jgi:L-lactate permease